MPRRRKTLVMCWARWDKTGKLVDARYSEPEKPPEPVEVKSKRGAVAQGALDL